MQACSKPQVFYECSFHIIISQWGIDFAIVMGSGLSRLVKLQSTGSHKNK
jgi:hypothetical protein